MESKFHGLLMMVAVLALLTIVLAEIVVDALGVHWWDWFRPDPEPSRYHIQSAQDRPEAKSTRGFGGLRVKDAPGPRSE